MLLRTHKLMAQEGLLCLLSDTLRDKQHRARKKKGEEEVRRTRG